jgi:hypothetical protein
VSSSQRHRKGNPMTRRSEVLSGSCDRCGIDDGSSLTVQRNGEAVCYRCVNEYNERIREMRRQARQNAPRCNVEGCNRRGTWRAGGALLCGHHKSKVEQRIMSQGIMGSLAAAQADRDTVVAMASKP